MLPGMEGVFGIKANHVPVISQLRPGLVELHSGGEVEKFFISGGWAFVHPNGTTDIQAIEAVTLDQVDAAAVKSALAAANSANSQVCAHTACSLRRRHARTHTNTQTRFKRAQMQTRRWAADMCADLKHIARHMQCIAYDVAHLYSRLHSLAALVIPCVYSCVWVCCRTRWRLLSTEQLWSCTAHWTQPLTPRHKQSAHKTHMRARHKARRRTRPRQSARKTHMNTLMIQMYRGTQHVWARDGRQGFKAYPSRMCK